MTATLRMRPSPLPTLPRPDIGYSRCPIGGKQLGNTRVAGGGQALARETKFAAAEISEVEINPLAVFAAGSGCSALDCVIIPKPARPD